ncbi:uncharacterized protein LOC112056516 isoform X2 [Bicyclus anynana]|uniref:Uncharacterized protein LOC112056516 isoform X2 n=1 Tax=Bicyclus anynana TaxID=110368 RepID=A0A6J1P4K1_BICAN|nr:uncharacterized protein LOC112056516 isoform X2 [Bicyclus anynana]
MSNKEENNSGAMVPYTNEINDYQMQFEIGIESLQATAQLEQKLLKYAKKRKEMYGFIRNTNSLLETEIKHDEEKIESMHTSIAASKSRITDLKKQLLLAKEAKENAAKKADDQLKKYEEMWLVCKTRFQSIPFVKRYYDVVSEVDSVRGNIESLLVQSKQLDRDINSKKVELWCSDKKRIIELAEYMVHKRPALLKLIDEKTKKMKTNNFVFKNTLSDVNTVNQPRQGIRDTFVLPKLQLLNMPSTVSNHYDKLQEGYRSAESYSYSTNNSHTSKSSDKNNENVYVSSFFLTSSKTAKQKKYSDRKLITILDNVKLDTNGTYKILSKLNPYELHDVNVIDAAVSEVKETQHKDKVTEQTEVIEEIDLTKEVSKEVILPVTQIEELTQVNEERDEVMENIDLTNNVSQDIIPPPTQFLTLSQSQVSDKIITSEYFDKNKKCDGSNINIEPEKIDVEVLQTQDGNVKESENKTVEENQLNKSDISEGQMCPQKDDAPSALLAFRNFIQDLPYISLDTTGSDDADVEFPQCDPTLLLSPKADYETQTINKEVDVQQENVPSFMAGYKKARTFFGSTSGNQPESDEQNQSTNFNFMFGGQEKTKRGGLFSMFR